MYIIYDKPAQIAGIDNTKYDLVNLTTLQEKMRPKIAEDIPSNWQQFLKDEYPHYKEFIPVLREDKVTVDYYFEGVLRLTLKLHREQKYVIEMAIIPSWSTHPQRVYAVNNEGIVTQLTDFEDASDDMQRQVYFDDYGNIWLERRYYDGEVTHIALNGQQAYTDEESYVVDLLGQALPQNVAQVLLLTRQADEASLQLPIQQRIFYLAQSPFQNDSTNLGIVKKEYRTLFYQEIGDNDYIIVTSTQDQQLIAKHFPYRSEMTKVIEVEDHENINPADILEVLT